MLPVFRCSRRLVPALPLLLRLSIASTTMGNQASAKGSDPVYNVKDAPQPKVGEHAREDRGSVRLSSIHPFIRLRFQKKSFVLD